MTEHPEPLIGDDRRALRWHRALFDELPMPVFVKDLEGRYLAVNRRFDEEFESRGTVSGDNVIGTTDFEHMPRSDAELYQRKDRQVLDGHAIRGLEERLERADGSAAFFSTTKVPITDDDGVVEGLLGFSFEYGQMSAVDPALVASERRHRLALRGSRDGIWEYDTLARLIYFNDRSRQLLDIPHDGDHIAADTFMGWLSPAAVDVVRNSIQRVIDDPTELVDVQFDYQHPDGTTHTMHLTGAALNDSGSTTSVIGSIADVTAAIDLQRRLRHLALHDDLTELANRRALVNRIEGAIAGSGSWTLMFCDLDNFKLVNDSLGHQVGDELLQIIGSTIKGVVGPNDFVARLGGDEFAVLTPHSADNVIVAECCEAILSAVSRRVRLGGTSLYTTMSIGVASLDGYTRAGTLLRDADTALYRAKETKGIARWFRPEMRQRAVTTQRLHTDIHQALDRDEFTLVYQPVVDAGRNRLVSVEALLRWRRSDGKLEAPGEFLPFLEQTGLIVDVGDWVMQEACRQIAEWRSEHELWELPVSVNLSRVQMRHDGLIDRIEEVVEANGIDYDAIVFEVTETAIAGDIDAMATGLNELRKLGARVAIDDFGVGQSCLGQLEELAVDTLKIDRLFIARLAEEDRPHPILSSMLWLAKNLGLTVVAEGVEHAAQADWLREQGCDHLQGYWFDRPLAAADIVGRCREGHPEGLYGGL